MNLGELRRYIADMLADPSGGKSDRVIQRVANAALSGIYGAHAWTRFRSIAHVPLDLALARTSLSIALDGNQLTCGASEVLLQKFVDESWLLTITGDNDLFFTLSHLENERSARLSTGQKWIQTTASAVAGVFKRTRYPLPDGCQTVRACELAVGGRCLTALRSDQFDRLRFENPTETGSPQWFTARQGEIEVWPTLGASTTRDALVLSYDREPAVFTTSTPDGTEVDWDDRWDDLIRLAVDMELASRHQAVSRLDPMVCRTRLKERLHTCKGDDEGLVEGTTTMTLGGSGGWSEADFYRLHGTTGDEV